jgi:hydrogenase maturation protein HypF
MAFAFHAALADMLAEGACRAAEAAGLGRVLLTGGSFANRLLAARIWHRLRDAELAVYSHALVPPGDGGLALGQAVVAAARLARGLVPGIPVSKG